MNKIAYYNENDPKAAAWLRELIRAQLIAPGDVDERSITEVQGSDLDGYTQCHFFAGIAGWSVALRLAGWDDRRPVWTGSCPCQPFSVAGKGKGTADKRHLWPEFRRLIAECNPSVVFGEQVASPPGRKWLAGVRTDLEALGYGVGAADLCAASVGAPHIRQRLFWLADCDSEQQREWRVDRSEDSSRPEGLLQPCGRSVDGGLEDSSSNRTRDSCFETRDEKRSFVDSRATSIRPGDRETCADRIEPNGSITGGLSDSENTDGRRGAGEYAESQGSRRGESSVSSGLDDSDDSGPQGHSGNGDGRDEPGRHDQEADGSQHASLRRPWDDTRPISCRDGKTRRLKSGLEPLVNGLPGRVGLLRGYGNAIVPQVAAEFIRAGMD